ncbi:hypothetical protein I4U23_003848 [Adineta vaga]|nr:hypothetical protein I4U23_003848 [Adineta vaga]
MATSNTSVSYEILSKVPVQVTINNKEFQLATFLWRDFMPRIVPDNYVETSSIPGSHLIAKLKISTIDNSEFPSDIKVNRVWIILNKTQIWETSVQEGESRVVTNSVLSVKQEMVRNRDPM